MCLEQRLYLWSLCVQYLSEWVSVPQMQLPCAASIQKISDDDKSQPALVLEDQLCGRGKEQRLLNPNPGCSCTLLMSVSPFGVCPCYLLKSKMTPVVRRLLLLLLLESPALSSGDGCGICHHSQRSGSKMLMPVTLVRASASP